MTSANERPDIQEIYEEEKKKRHRKKTRTKQNHSFKKKMLEVNTRFGEQKKKIT